MEKEWTIIILIYADFHIDGSEKLTRELSSLMGDITFCTLGEKNELLIIYNQIKLVHNNTTISDTTFVLRAMPSDFGLNKLEKIYEIPSENVVQKADLLGKIFYKINNNQLQQNGTELKTKAEHYFLLTWDHGSGFGIFRRDRNSIENSFAFKFGHNLSVNKPKFHFDANMEVQALGLEYPKNIFYDKSNRAMFIERKNDNPIAFYAIPKEKTVLRLNTFHPAQAVFDKLLKENSFVENVKISRDNDRLFFQYKNSFVDPNKNSLINWINDDEFDIIKKHLRVENQNVSFSLDSNNEIQNKIIDVLTNEELNTAIQTGFEKQKLDVLLMMNCYMMNIHTLYALKDSVNILVAPQGGIDEPGYNYQAILYCIYSSLTAITANNLSLSCILTSVGNLAGRMPFKSIIEEWAVFQTNVNYKNVAAKIDDIARFCLITNDLKFMNSVRDIRSLCVKFDRNNANYYLIDFCHWISHLIKHLKKHYNEFDTTFLQNCFDDIKNDLSKMVINPSLIGGSIYDSNTPDGMFKDDPTTLGIYFPSDIDKIQDEYVYFVSPETQNQSLFLNEMKNWLLFLEAL